jgi:hypothetical protein
MAKKRRSRKKQQKQTKTLITILVIVAAIFLLSNLKQPEERAVDITAQYFDADGNEVVLKQSFLSTQSFITSPTVTQIPGEVTNIVLTANVENTGNVPFQVDVKNTFWLSKKGVVEPNSQFIEPFYLDVSEKQGHNVAEFTFEIRDINDTLIDTIYYEWAYERDPASCNVIYRSHFQGYPITSKTGSYSGTAWIYYNGNVYTQALYGSCAPMLAVPLDVVYGGVYYDSANDEIIFNNHQASPQDRCSKFVRSGYSGAETSTCHVPFDIYWYNGDYYDFVLCEDEVGNVIECPPGSI